MQSFKNIVYTIIIFLIIFIGMQDFKFKVNIENIEPIIILGLDSFNDGTLKLTFLRNPTEGTPSGTEESSSEEKQVTPDPADNSKNSSIETPLALAVSGPTYNGSLKTAQNYSDKFLLTNSIKYYFIGENTATERGILREIDFISGNENLRLNSRIFITKGLTSEELLQKANKDLYSKLNTILENTEQLEFVRNLSFLDVLRNINNTNSASVIPTIEVTKIGGIDEANISGLAILKKDKIISYLNFDELIYYSLLRTNLKGFNIDIEDTTLGNMSFGMNINKKDIDFEFDGNTLKKVKYNIHLMGNLKEMSLAQDLNSSEVVTNIENTISNQVKSNLYKITTKSKLLETDFLRISDIVSSKYYNKWLNSQHHWDLIISDVEFEITVNTTITRSFNLKNSI